MVALEGSAPPISGCRPDVMLFHHRAKLAAGDGLAPPRSPSKGDVLLLDDPATNWWAREDLHLQGSQTLNLWGLLFPLNHSPKNWCSRPDTHRQTQPSEGCTLVIELQERKNGCSGRTFLQRKPAGCCQEANGWWAATALARVLRFKRPLHHA